MSLQMELTNKQEGKFIYYDGKCWLVHQYNKDLNGWFASPLFYPQPETVEVGVGAGNWCYASNGAFLRDPESEIMKKAYLSYLEHLNWCKETQIKQDCDLTKINTIIRFYEDLL